MHYWPVTTVTMREIRTIAGECGSHFFDRDTRRFFGSRVAVRKAWKATPIEDHLDVYTFVTFEDMSRTGGPVGYTARIMQHWPHEGRVHFTVIGEPYDYHTLDSAKVAARWYAHFGGLFEEDQ